jgi:fructose-1-phosphate kinase PfkB-like protein
MLGLALEGGGAKGAYEIGAYRALTELGYHFDVICGVSIGAINAALLAQGVQRVFLSMGADGILAGTREELVHLPCLPTCMVNTTGGGDAVMAALVWAYLQGLDLRESAAAALRAGKATVEYPGTNNPDLGALVHG